MEVIKVEPDTDREALLLVSHSGNSQNAIKEEDHSHPFTFVSVKTEDKVGVLQLKILGKTKTKKGMALKYILQKYGFQNMNWNQVAEVCVQW
jgi:hypothetical protein